MKGAKRITKKQFYDLGGFRNGELFRRHNGRHWGYYHLLD